VTDGYEQKCVENIFIISSRMNDECSNQQGQRDENPRRSHESEFFNEALTDCMIDLVGMRQIIRHPALIAPAILKIGMYIAITIPPMTPPRTTIITGSINEVRASTAASTSSS
jgi:hypothetical protein